MHFGATYDLHTRDYNSIIVQLTILFHELVSLPVMLTILVWTKFDNSLNLLPFDSSTEGDWESIKDEDHWRELFYLGPLMGRI